MQLTLPLSSGHVGTLVWFSKAPKTSFVLRNAETSQPRLVRPVNDVHRPETPDITLADTAVEEVQECGQTLPRRINGRSEADSQSMADSGKGRISDHHQREAWAWRWLPSPLHTPSQPGPGPLHPCAGVSRIPQLASSAFRPRLQPESPSLQVAKSRLRRHQFGILSAEMYSRSRNLITHPCNGPPTPSSLQSGTGWLQPDVCAIASPRKSDGRGRVVWFILDNDKSACCCARLASFVSTQPASTGC